MSLLSWGYDKAKMVVSNEYGHKGKAKKRFSIVVGTVMLSAVLVGSTLASIPGVAHAQANGVEFAPVQKYNVETSRVYGADRYATAVEISKKGWVSADTVVLVRGDNFPDALAGAPLAYKENAPILLTERNKLTSVTKQEIQRLKAKKVIILGGETAVSSAVVNELKNMGLFVDRISGNSRYDTAVKIADRLGQSDTVVVADGRNFPDALAVAPYAAKNGYPIILVDKYIPEEAKGLLANAKKIIVVGGESAVGKEIYSQLNNAIRLAGVDRYDTAVKIISYEYTGNVDAAFVATGGNFADALTGAVLAAKEGKPIILTKSDGVTNQTMDLVKNKDVKNFTVLGGTSAVRVEVLEMLKTRTTKPAAPPSNNQQSGTVSIEIDGEKKSFSGFVQNGVVFVPLQDVFGALGAKVLYDNETYKYHTYKWYSNGSVMAEFKNGSDVAVINGVDVKLQAKATSKNGALMIPASALNKALGVSVSVSGNVVKIKTTSTLSGVGKTKVKGMQVMFGRHAYGSLNQNEYDEVMKIVKKELDRVFSPNWDGLLYGITKEEENYFLSYLDGKRWDGSRSNDSPENVALYIAEESLGDLVKAGVSKSEIIRLLKINRAALDAKEPARGVDVTPRSAYDALVRLIDDCDSTANTLSVFFDAMGYNTMIVGMPNHALTLVEVNGYWFEPFGLSFRSWGKTADVMKMISDDPKLYVFEQPTFGPYWKN